MSSQRFLFLPAVAAALLTAGGCASEGPRPVEELARAKAVVEQADKQGAQRYAAAELQRAHDELSDADKATADRKYNEARRYAEAAAADADLASARQAAGEAQQASHDVKQSIDTLRQESNRGAPDTSGTNR
ncbi:MAG TPA: DUF4398 domain-containing protein [Steroidobacteraceae bacterium]|nr:DUF4398 domain-containing protein [Steroidobacteraceae bacterium]